MREKTRFGGQRLTPSRPHTPIPEVAVLRDYFGASELACKCGYPSCKHRIAKISASPTLGLRKAAAEALLDIRVRYGRALVVTSALRCVRHPEEAKKELPGSHSARAAFDIRPLDNTGLERRRLLNAIIASRRAKGLGIAKTFFHVDVYHPRLTRPSDGVIWTY